MDSVLVSGLDLYNSDRPCLERVISIPGVPSPDGTGCQSSLGTKLNLVGSSGCCMLHDLLCMKDDGFDGPTWGCACLGCTIAAPIRADGALATLFLAK